MARLNHEKANRLYKAKQDVREAMEEGAIDDVFVRIDPNYVSDAIESKTVQQWTAKVRERHSLTAQLNKRPPIKYTTEPKPRSKAKSNSRQQSSSSSEPLTAFKQLISQAKSAQPTKRVSHEELLGQLNSRTVKSAFKQIDMPFNSNCVSCPVRLRIGRKHYFAKSLRYFVCANCFHDVVRITKNPSHAIKEREPGQEKSELIIRGFEDDPVWKHLFLMDDCTVQVPGNPQIKVRRMGSFVYVLQGNSYPTIQTLIKGTNISEVIAHAIALPIKPVR
jgi:hypothetical protein